MSKSMSKAKRADRSPAPAELNGYRKQFECLAVQFDDHAATLMRSPDNLMVIPEMRSAMSRAGHALTRLLFHGAIAAPPRLPPWLSWRTRGNARPRFVGLHGRPFLSSWSPRSTVLGLVWHMRPGPQVVDKSTPRRPGEDIGAVFIRRHTWIEGVAGWIGQRCTPRSSVNVPTVQALAVTGSGDASRERRIHIVHDWIEDPTQQRLLFLDLARDSAVACRHLVAEFGTRASESLHGPQPHAWEARDAFHRATMALYTDLGALVEHPPEQRSAAIRQTPTASNATANARTAAPRSPALRPSATAIDATATRILVAAMQAGHDAGEPYVPSRVSIAKAVGTELNIKITVETLFGTKEKAGLRVPRYPCFTKLWKQTRQSSHDSRRAKVNHSRRP